MALPSQGQSVHMMNWFGVLQVLWRMWRKEGRNVAELALYTTDHLGEVYQTTDRDTIQLPDGIISRVQLVAVIRWRIWWARFGYGLLLVVTIAAAFFAFMSWRFPVHLLQQDDLHRNRSPACPLNKFARRT